MHSLSKLAFCANTRYIFYLFSQVFSLSLSFSLSNNLTIYLSLSLSPQPPTHTHSYTHTLSVVCIFCFFYHHISLFIVYPLSPHPMAHAMVCTDQSHVFITSQPAKKEKFNFHIFITHNMHTNIPTNIYTHIHTLTTTNITCIQTNTDTYMYSTHTHAYKHKQCTHFTHIYSRTHDAVKPNIPDFFSFLIHY